MEKRNTIPYLKERRGNIMKNIKRLNAKLLEKSITEAKYNKELKKLTDELFDVLYTLRNMGGI